MATLGSKIKRGARAGGGEGAGRRDDDTQKKKHYQNFQIINSHLTQAETKVRV